MSIQSDAAQNHIVQLLCSEPEIWYAEYRFHPKRKWRFDYAVPYLRYAIEIDGGTFQSSRTGHSSGVGLRGWREKNNAAMSLGWGVWHYSPDEIIKAGRKTIEDEPVLLKLPWK